MMMMMMMMMMEIGHIVVGQEREIPDTIAGTNTSTRFA